MNSESSQEQRSVATYDATFGLILPQFDWVPAPRYLMRRERILTFLQDQCPKGRLLEIGCGTGAMLEDFCRLGYTCDAVEISEAALGIARSVHQGKEDLTLFNSFPDGKFEYYDVIVSCEVIEHIEDDITELRKWGSALKKGGVLIISTPANPKNFNALDRWAGHFRRYTKASLGEICNKAGLHPERFEFYGYPLVELTEKIRGWLCERQLKRSEREKNLAMQEATEKSGIDRGVESKLFPLLNSFPGRLVFKQLLRLQKRYLHREIGNGMLCFAIKK